MQGEVLKCKVPLTIKNPQHEKPIETPIINLPTSMILNLNCCLNILAVENHFPCTRSTIGFIQMQPLLNKNDFTHIGVLAVTPLPIQPSELGSATIIISIP